MHPSSNIPQLFTAEQRPSFGKQNVSCYSVYETTDRQIQNDKMFKEFQTLKQINRILDSNPESEEAKNQKIRSLVIMFKRQLDINKKLECQVADFLKKVDGIEKELLIRNTQVQNYEKTIFDQKQKIIVVESENKRLTKVIEENKEQIKVRQDLIQKMKQTYENQKYSMENQLHFLKQKTIEHFAEKLNFPLNQLKEKDKENLVKKSKTQSRVNSAKKNEAKSVSKTKKEKSQKKKNIIQRNILAISKKENQLMSGQNLLKKFEEAKILSQRMSQIRKGTYHSAMGNHY